MFSYSFSFTFLLCLLFNQSWTLILVTDLMLQFVLLRLLVRTYFLRLLFFSLSYRRYLSARLTYIAPGHCFSFHLLVSRRSPLTPIYYTPSMTVGQTLPRIPFTIRAYLLICYLRRTDHHMYYK